jgi:hypothetical protein
VLELERAIRRRHHDDDDDGGDRDEPTRTDWARLPPEPG